MKDAEINGTGAGDANATSTEGVYKPACTPLLHGQNCGSRPKHVYVGPCLHEENHGPQILVGKCSKCGTGFRHIESGSQVCCMCQN